MSLSRRIERQADRVKSEHRVLTSLLRIGIERAGGLRPTARLAGVSPGAVRYALDGKGRLDNLAKIEAALLRAGHLSHLAAPEGVQDCREVGIGLHEALLDSPLAKDCYADWQARGGVWPVEDGSFDAEWSAGLSRRGSVILLGGDGFRFRYLGPALQTRRLPDRDEPLGSGFLNSGLGTRAQARLQVCRDLNIPVSVQSHFRIDDVETEIACVILNLPWRTPSGGALFTSVSERIYL